MSFRTNLPKPSVGGIFRLSGRLWRPGRRVLLVRQNAVAARRHLEAVGHQNRAQQRRRNCLIQAREVLRLLGLGDLHHIHAARRVFIVLDARAAYVGSVEQPEPLAYA